MDTVQHMAWGYLVGLNVAGDPVGSLAYSGAATVPDVIGWFGVSVKRNWTVYQLSHNIPVWLGLFGVSVGAYFLGWISLPVLAFVFSPFLHVIFDSFGHRDGERWWVVGERLPFEISGWAAVYVLTVLTLLLRF